MHMDLKYPMAIHIWSKTWHLNYVGHIFNFRQQENMIFRRCMTLNHHIQAAVSTFWPNYGQIKLHK